MTAIVLAAGQSTRMGSTNKLLVPIDGVPMVRRVVDNLSASRARPVIVVTGFERRKVEAVLGGAKVELVHNPEFAAGMGGSLAAGARALPANAQAALVCLGDMPYIGVALIDALIDRFQPSQADGIWLPVSGGESGHPVLFGRAHFPALEALSGDRGARGVVAGAGVALHRVALEDPAVLTDIDSQADL